MLLLSSVLPERLVANSVSPKMLGNEVGIAPTQDLYGDNHGREHVGNALSSRCRVSQRVHERGAIQFCVALGLIGGSVKRDEAPFSHVSRNQW